MTGSGEKVKKSTRMQVNLANRLLRFQCSHRPPRARRYLRNLRFRESGSRSVYSLNRQRFLTLKQKGRLICDQPPFCSFNFQLLKTLLASLGLVSTSFGSRCSAGLRRGAADCHRHFAANLSWHTSCFCHTYRTWYTPGLGDIPRAANLFAGGVRNFACAGLLLIAAGSVRNLAGPALFNHGASGVGNLLGYAFFLPAAGCVRNLAGSAFTYHAAGCVRNLLGSCFALITNAGVRHLAGNAAGNSLTYGVRNPLLYAFAFVSCAADFAGDRLGTPDSSANSCAGALDFHFLAATGFVDRAAGAAIVFPGSWLTDTFLNNRTGAMLGNRFPFTTADFNVLPGVDRLTNSATDITVAGFVLVLVDRAADFTVVSLANRSSDSIADITITGVVNRLADCVADIAVAGVIHRPTAFAGYSAVAGFVTGTADFVADIPVTGVVDRLADRVTFITIAGLVNILGILDGNFFADRIIDCLLTGVVLLFPYGFYDSFVAGT